MLFKLGLLFILIPLVELAILVFLGTIIGFWYTILIIITTGFLGAFMARRQGIKTLSRIRSSLEQGIVPSNELFHGALIVVGGLLLLTPGLITDITGFALLLPQTRRIIGKAIVRQIRRKIQSGQIQYWEL